MKLQGGLQVTVARKDYPDYLKEWQQLATLLKDQNEQAVEKEAKKGFSKGGYRGMLEGSLRVQRELNNRGVVPAYSLAVTYARLGDKKNSLHSLNIAYHSHDSSLLFLSTEPAFDFLRGDPEFTDIERRVSPLPRSGDASATRRVASPSPPATMPKTARLLPTNVLVSR